MELECAIKLVNEKPVAVPFVHFFPLFGPITYTFGQIVIHF
jgi:hypothetical protein